MTMFRPIKAPFLKTDKIRLELLNTLRKVGRGMKKEFEATTRTWSHDVKFEVLISLAKGAATVIVETNDEIYGYVNEGTDPHLIVPVNAKVLAFPGDYTSKTVPGVIDSRDGGSGGETIFAAYVEHPGTKARNFSQVIAARWEEKFRYEIEGAIRRGLTKS